MPTHRESPASLSLIIFSFPILSEHGRYGVYLVAGERSAW
jgi:hypothetical protein